MKILRLLAIAAVLVMGSGLSTAMAEELSPYGTSKADMHGFPKLNAVFDVNYMDPQDLNVLNSFVTKTGAALGGKMVVVTHGPELRAFAKENYVKYQGIMDKMKVLADKGVEFRMCNNALKAAGFSADDFHGFVTIVPAGFPEVALLQSQGYQYINPLANRVGGTRYIDQPGKKK